MCIHTRRLQARDISHPISALDGRFSSYSNSSSELLTANTDLDPVLDAVDYNGDDGKLDVELVVSDAVADPQTEDGDNHGYSCNDAAHHVV